MENLSLREVMKRVRQASICPTCGKSTFIAATSWRGHGTGQRGTSYYGATSLEMVTPETHCMCNKVRGVINQTRLGYQKTNKGLFSVVECVVLYADGSKATKWQLRDSDNVVINDLLDTCPQIDIPAQQSKEAHE